MTHVTSAPKSDGVPEGNDGEDPHFINFETISLPEDLLDTVKRKNFDMKD